MELQNGRQDQGGRKSLLTERKVRTAKSLEAERSLRSFSKLGVVPISKHLPACQQRGKRERGFSGFVDLKNHHASMAKGNSHASLFYRFPHMSYTLPIF